MKSTKVSVIAVCYNHERYVVETLESIKNQVFKNFELIIVDNCSSDASVRLIKDWAKVNASIDLTFIANKTNLGVAKALSEALALAKGEYLQFISCDDIVLPDKFDDQVKILDGSDGTVAAVFSDSYLIDSNSRLLHGRFIQRHLPLLTVVPAGRIYDVLIERGNFIPAMTCLTKIECIRKIGGFDQSLKYEDYDLWLRLSRSYHFLFDEKMTAKYRLLEGSLNTQLDYSVANFPIWLKHLDLKKSILKQRLLRILFYMYKTRHSELPRYYDLFKKNCSSIFGFRVFYLIGIPYRYYKLFYICFSRLGVK